MISNQAESILCPFCGGTKKSGFTTFTADVKDIVAVIRQVTVTICSLYEYVLNGMTDMLTMLK